MVVPALLEMGMPCKMGKPMASARGQEMRLRIFICGGSLEIQLMSRVALWQAIGQDMCCGYSHRGCAEDCNVGFSYGRT